MKKTFLLLFILSFPFSLMMAQEEKEEKIYQVVEQWPSFPGGDLAMSKFIMDNLQHPYEDKTLKGRVTVRFVVEKDSTISNVTVMRGLDPAYDKEAIRVIKAMPKWIPGKQNNEPTRTYFTLPIRFD